jgi:predicted phage replisome organizer
MFDDERIKLIEQMPDADSIIVIWIKLLVQAGKTNDNGYIYLNENVPYTEEMLSAVLGRPLSTVRLALGALVRLGMIEINDDVIYISNWSKHQNVEGLERIREQTRLRVAKHRANQKLLPDNTLKPKPTPVKIEIPFAEFWELYPRKEGKTAALKRFKIVIKKHDADFIITATKNYANECRINNTPTNYIKLPATFLGPNEWYEEWYNRKPRKHKSDYVGPSNEYKPLTNDD